ncbi:glycoside hydrolase family 13 protein [Halalkalibacter krulwichiae]|uniref:oligo-1,6-glucosidase n=1 Tax=Halalkalibacter krulwichiae TaxID=199441 RepID=A0A1X9M685_9BACI|nr:alpha-glucosidase [Halalkalibacter krulwichiae]ARK28956.1 Oligo-1,6-glucosidase [Halalkalibacter krulwichiae]
MEPWWKNSVVYQIYPRSFMDSNNDGIGDLQGVKSKLNYLKQLGIDVIWLSPVYDSPNDDNGYDIRDYQQIMDEFGTMDDWDQLLKEVHDMGMKLIMDLVVNHSSDEHVWFTQSKQSKDNHYRDYYIWRDGKGLKEPNNWRSNFGGSAWKLDEQTDQYYLHLFSEKQPDLNWENRNLRHDIYQMMRWWLNKGIDGFRMDVINFISKVDDLPDDELKPGQTYASGSKYYRNGPKIHEFLQEMNKEALAGFDVMTVGEMPGVQPEQAQLYTDPSRTELNMVFQFEHMGLDQGPNGKWELSPLKLRDLKRSLSKWQYALEEKGWNSLYFNNHDQPRSVSRFGDDGVCRIKSAKMLATLLHMMKGTPYVYQGEEIGMTNVPFTSINQYRDIETLNIYKELRADGKSEEDIFKSLHAKSRDNARTPMQWSDQEQAGFTNGVPWIDVNPNYKEINVQKAIADPHSIYHYYRKLIELRKSYDVIVNGTYELILEDDPNVFAYTRTLEDEQLIVLCNFYGKKTSVSLPEGVQLSEATLLVGNDEENEIGLENELVLSPYAARVYYKKEGVTNE